MNWTNYHAQYFAHELTQRLASRVATEGFDDADNLDKLTASLSDAQVDLNPHQVDAALFALRSPLSQGVILADEVGLGKTIEAGIVVAQRWAERRRHILIIAPANLRKQWSQELADKFFLPSLILEKKSFDEAIKQKNFNPFYQNERIVICSFQFARAKSAYLDDPNWKWDLVVIDEAHRLRNVYRKDNKIGNAIKEALSERFKILLTATPLQNSLLELYGLVSLVDDYVFGDLRSFKQQYSKLTAETQFLELKQRIAPVCKRTLRAQVREYIRYTDRICMTHDFEPADDEHLLYEQVSEYLRKEKLYALPKSQRALMTLILRKILASSTFAIADTLKGLVQKLEKIIQQQAVFYQNEENTEGGDLQLKIKNEELNGENWQSDYELTDNIKDEWNDDPDFEDESEESVLYLSPKELEEIQAELAEIQDFYDLAKRIQSNSKGDNLVVALKKGFEKMRELGAAEKAVIFTESVRTQRYIKEILEFSGFKNQIVLFNGSNSDVESTQIYRQWLRKNEGSERVTGSRATDIRAALTEHFRDEAKILIATEAAAEGINLQFCSLVVNYDMPWNPQRIEQRVGRCHRYGQRFNVVVINFKNNRNAADMRVYELLHEKLNLFNGVFGASDEVLGAIESGVDFEKRIVQIYQQCRTEAEINAAFQDLWQNFQESIAQKLDQTHQQLIENFDEEVLEKIKTQTDSKLDIFEEKFWRFSRFALEPYADTVDNQNFSFHLRASPTPSVPTGNFRFLSHRLPFDRQPKDAQMYRINHPLAAHFLTHFKGLKLPIAEVVFDYAASPTKISVFEQRLADFGGQISDFGASPAPKSEIPNPKSLTGWLSLKKLIISGLETDETLIFAAFDDDGTLLDTDTCRRLFSLVGQMSAVQPTLEPAVFEALETQIEQQKNQILSRRETHDLNLFKIEMDKLDRWAEDRRVALHTELRELEAEIRLQRNLARQMQNLAERVKAQRHITDLEKKLADKRFRLHAEEDGIEARKNEFLDIIEAKLDATPTLEAVFTMRWRLAMG